MVSFFCAASDATVKVFFFKTICLIVLRVRKNCNFIPKQTAF